LFNRLRVNVTDGKILQQILVNEAYNFVKPKVFLGPLRQVLGDGLILAEGEVHKKQRKLMNPPFNHNCIKVKILISILFFSKDLDYLFVCLFIYLIFLT